MHYRFEQAQLVLPGACFKGSVMKKVIFFWLIFSLFVWTASSPAQPPAQEVPQPYYSKKNPANDPSACYHASENRDCYCYQRDYYIIQFYHVITLFCFNYIFCYINFCASTALFSLSFISSMMSKSISFVFWMNFLKLSILIWSAWEPFFSFFPVL